jgi:hypothetical protein
LAVAVLFLANEPFLLMAGARPDLSLVVAEDFMVLRVSLPRTWVRASCRLPGRSASLNGTSYFIVDIPL